MYWGFQELPSRVRAKAARMALPLDERLSRGQVELAWRAPMEQLADALAADLLATVRKGGFKRVFIDSIAGFTDALVYPERISTFLSALGNELRAAGATTVYSLETRDMHGSNLELPLGFAQVADSVVLLRYVELRSKLHRLISVLKSREAPHDASIREFTIDDHGIQVESAFPGAEDVLSGLAHETTGAGKGRKQKQKQQQKRTATRRPRRT